MALTLVAHWEFAGCGLGYDGSIHNFGARRRFMRSLVHTRRCGVLPQSANRSMASPIPKSGAAKRGPESLRLIHVLCPFWRSWCRAALCRGPSLSWASYHHGFLPGRRREGAMMIMRISQWRSKQMGFEAVSCFHDLVNAFGCTEQNSLLEMIKGDDLCPRQELF